MDCLTNSKSGRTGNIQMFYEKNATHCIFSDCQISVLTDTHNGRQAHTVLASPIHNCCFWEPFRIPLQRYGLIR